MPVVVALETPLEGRQPIRRSGRLGRKTQDASQAPRQSEGPHALEARARLTAGEKVAPGGAAVRGGQEEVEHGPIHRPRV
jgi:hypothetical protein